MRKSKLTDSQIMTVVKRIEAGFAVPDICRELHQRSKVLQVAGQIRRQGCVHDGQMKELEDKNR